MRDSGRASAVLLLCCGACVVIQWRLTKMCYAPAHNASPASILLSVIAQTASFSRGLRTAVALIARSTVLSGLHMRSAATRAWR